MRLSNALALLSALCLLPNLAAAQLTSDPGFAVTDTVPLGGPSAYGSLADGRYVTFDGLSFDLYANDGTWQTNLGAISSFMWPSFVEVDPTGTFVIAGESTSGCVRASVADAYNYGFHVVVVEECCFDRNLLSHKVNLFDMHHKYADVMHFDEIAEHLELFPEA